MIKIKTKEKPRENRKIVYVSPEIHKKLCAIAFNKDEKIWSVTETAMLAYIAKYDALEKQKALRSKTKSAR